MSRAKKIVLVVAARVIVGLRIDAAVSGGSLGQVKVWTVKAQALSTAQNVKPAQAKEWSEAPRGRCFLPSSRSVWR